MLGAIQRELTPARMKSMQMSVPETVLDSLQKTLGYANRMAGLTMLEAKRLDVEFLDLCGYGQPVVIRQMYRQITWKAFVDGLW